MFRNIKKNVRMRLTFETLKRYTKQKSDTGGEAFGALQKKGV